MNRTGPGNGLIGNSPSTLSAFSGVCRTNGPASYNAVAMNLSRTVRLLLALASGVALALAYPSFNIPLLGWIAPALLIVAVLGERPRFGFLLGWVQGAAYFGLSLPWFYNVMRQYGPLPVIQAGGVFALVIVVMSLFHAAFAAAIAWVGKSAPERACLAAPFLWVAMEFASMHMPAIGFPWNLLGYVAAGNLALVQMTAITGIFGLSLLVAAYNGLAAWALLQISRHQKTGLKLWAGTTAALLLIGVVGPRFVPEAPADHVAHLVQTNFPVALNYPSDWMQVHAPEMDQLEAISIGSGQKVPGIVVWPEVPAPFSLQEGYFLARAQRIARGAGNGFLVGVIDYKPLDNGKSGANNSAVFLGPTGSLDFTYDKIHLVPFSEYVPWRKWLFFASDLTGLIGDFQHGSQYKVGRITGGPFSVYICYEAIFPNEIRRFTLAGAQLFVNISDDGWFGGSGAPGQHMAMALPVRAENRRWLLRDTNDGIAFSASVDPYGRIVARLRREDSRRTGRSATRFGADLTP